MAVTTVYTSHHFLMIQDDTWDIPRTVVGLQKAPDISFHLYYFPHEKTLYTVYIRLCV